MGDIVGEYAIAIAPAVDFLNGCCPVVKKRASQRSPGLRLDHPKTMFNTQKPEGLEGDRIPINRLFTCTSGFNGACCKTWLWSNDSRRTYLSLRTCLNLLGKCHGSM